MYNKFMDIAVSQAKKALDMGEIPVGAVIVKDNIVIAECFNKRESLNNALCHAEICAIDKACKFLGNWRLDGCDMYVTLEPCPMCTGAILQARIKNVYFGAYSRDNGCMGTVLNLPKLLKNNTLTVYGGIMEEKCAELLKSFFKDKKTGL